jgi:hypothetical protein
VEHQQKDVSRAVLMQRTEGNGPRPEGNVHYDIRQWRIDYYPSGELRRWEGVLEPSLEFTYDQEDGFGGVVTASSFQEAQEKVLLSVAHHRGRSRSAAS